MDATDQKLIELLKADSRTPLKRLAAEVGLARSTVQERIKKLEENSVIRRYTIEVAEPDASLVEAYLWIRTQSVTCASVAPRIAKLPGVLQCRSIAGDQDLVVHARSETHEHLAELRSEIAAIDGIASVETHLVLKDWA